MIGSFSETFGIFGPWASMKRYLPLAMRLLTAHSRWPAIADSAARFSSTNLLRRELQAVTIRSSREMWPGLEETKTINSWNHSFRYDYGVPGLFWDNVYCFFICLACFDWFGHTDYGFGGWFMVLEGGLWLWRVVLLRCDHLLVPCELW